MSPILVTIGPVSDSIDQIKGLGRYTNSFRLNGSHGTIEWHREIIGRIRAVFPEAFILMDMPGVKPRTCNSKRVKIGEGEVVSFGSELGRKLASPSHKYIQLTRVLPEISSSAKLFSINDDQYKFDVVDHGPGWISGRARGACVIAPKQGLNLVGSVYDEENQFQVYMNFFRNIENFGVDALGLSFVQTGALVSSMRAEVGPYQLISKIENSLGWSNRREIALNSDAIMIDRGDLCAEVGASRLMDCFADISAATIDARKTLIVATENLFSMIKNESPTKSEIIALAYSLGLGAETIMLSEETAISERHIEITEWLSQFMDDWFARAK
jgi:pyruvate kinase